MQDTSVSWESVRVQLDSDFGGLIDSLALTKQQRGTSGSKPDSEEAGRHDLHTKYHAVHKLAHTVSARLSVPEMRSACKAEAVIPTARVHLQGGT